MAQAKRNPLAPGVYWLDVMRPFGSSSYPDHDPKFRDWVSRAGASVRILRRSPADHVVTSTGPENRDILPVFYVFEVLPPPAPPAPPFPFMDLGFPDIHKLSTAPGGVTDKDRAVTEDDVFPTPPASSRLTEFLNEAAPGLSAAVMQQLSSPTTWLIVGLAIWKLTRPART